MDSSIWDSFIDVKEIVEFVSCVLAIKFYINMYSKK